MEYREIAMQDNKLRPSGRVYSLFLILASFVFGVGPSAAQEGSLERSAGQDWTIEKSDGRL